MARGGGGGRIRFRAAKSGHASDAHDDMVRRRNTSRFNALNSGCFYKSGHQLCPSRLTDYYCVMWTEGPDEEQVAATAAAAAARQSPSNATTPMPTTAAAGGVDPGELVCSGDFTSDQIVLANCVLPLALLLLGSALNCLCGRLMLSYSSRQLPVCLYLVLLAGVDTAILWCRFLDLWLQSVFDLRVVLTLALMDESVCQLLNMAYSTLVHFKATLQVALAVDTGRMMRQPRGRFERYTAEWVKNSAILACVLVLLLNAHHLWTLTVVKENAAAAAAAASASVAMSTGGGGDADNVYYCGWTLRWPITELFTTWIWPTGDLLVGDLLPAVLVTVCCISGVAGGVRRGRGWRPWRGRRPSLAYYVIDVDLYCSLQLGLLACCAGYVVLSLPSLGHNCAMYAAFLAARLSQPFHHLHGGGGGGAEQPPWPLPLPPLPAQAGNSARLFAPHSEEAALYIARLCSGVQLLVSPILMFACVPRFRRDALALCASVLCRRRPGGTAVSASAALSASAAGARREAKARLRSGGSVCEHNSMLISVS